MALELTFLGTGTSSGVPMIGCFCEVCTSTDPRDHRTRPSVMVSYPRPRQKMPNGDAPRRDVGDFGFENTGRPGAGTPPCRLLVDTSPELRAQAVRHALDRIDGVFYTHAHADHIFGLDDLRRFNAVMDSPIDIYAEPHTLDTIRGMFKYIFEPHKNVNQSFVASLIAHTLEPGRSAEVLGATWTPVRVLHGRLPIAAFRVDRAGESLGYCTDVSGIPPESYGPLSDLDVLVIDGLRYRHHPTHFTVDQALEAIEALRPAKAFLTHIAHDIMHAELEPRLPRNVHLAYDGLVVDCVAARRSARAK